MTNGFVLGGVAQGLRQADQAQLQRDEFGLQERRLENEEERALMAEVDNSISGTLGVISDVIKQSRAAGASPDKIRATIAPLISDISEISQGAGRDPSRFINAINASIDAPVAQSLPGIVDVKRDGKATSMIRDPRTGKLTPIETPGVQADASGDAAGAAETPASDVKIIDVEAATGVRGFLGGAVNTITDALAGRLAIQDEAEASTALNALNVETSTTLQDAVPGRPSNFLLEQFKQIAVTPNSLLQGPADAREKFLRIHDLIERGISAIDESLATGKLTNPDTSKAVQKRAGLVNLLSQYKQLIDTQPTDGTPSVPIESFIRPGN